MTAGRTTSTVLPVASGEDTGERRYAVVRGVRRRIGRGYDPAPCGRRPEAAALVYDTDADAAVVDVRQVEQGQVRSEVTGLVGDLAWKGKHSDSQ